jgi:Ca2+-binding EF-hand superfamily protein
MSFLNDEQIDQISKAIFDKIDLDKNELIDFNELSKLMKQLAQEMKLPDPTDDTIKQMLNCLDKDQSGML